TREPSERFILSATATQDAERHPQWLHARPRTGGADARQRPVARLLLFEPVSPGSEVQALRDKESRPFWLLRNVSGAAREPDSSLRYEVRQTDSLRALLGNPRAIPTGGT